MKAKNTRFNYDFLIALIIFHAGTVAAIYFYFNYWLLLLAIIIWPIGHGIGLAIGYHRLLTHRGFKTPKWLEYVITICGNLTLQGGHIKWVAIHRKHHSFTDLPEDPHTPRESFYHSHFGWMLNGEKSFRTNEFLLKYAKDLCKDPFHNFLNRFWWLPSIIFGAILFLLGGLPAVLWGVIVPVTVGLHFTWLVNSVCHYWGSQQFETGDDSTNNLWVALLTWGEGWHNNHHDKPVRARHGLIWQQIDFSWMFIWTLSKIGLAKEVKL